MSLSRIVGPRKSPVFSDFSGENHSCVSVGIWHIVIGDESPAEFSAFASAVVLSESRGLLRVDLWAYRSPARW